MRKQDLLEFAGRARAPVAEQKAQFWQEAHRANGRASMEAAHAAFEHARSVANFPPPGYLELDFAHHVALKQLIDRASAAFPVR